MKKSSALIACGVVFSAFTGVVISQAVKGNALSSFAPVLADPTDPSTMTLNSSNKPAGLTASYQNKFAGAVHTDLGNEVEMSFVNAKSSNGNFVQLAPHGKIFNFGSTNDPVTGVNGVSFTGSGSFLFKPAVTKGILADVAPISVTAGAAAVEVPACDYFEIEAGDSGATITSLQFSYSCDVNAYDIKLLNGTYTGIGDNSFTYKLVINNGSATVDSLDKESNNDHLVGTASMTSKTNVQLSFTGINYVMTYDGHALNFVSKSGDYAAAVPEISFNRVYNVEDFESYTATGTGYVSADAKYTTTGLRSAYYADYYTGSSSGEIGGSGWPIMTSTDNTNYNSQKGHNSSKVGIFKFSNGTSMRYISMNELYGVNSLIGKGTTLSFWARGAYTNANFNTNHGSSTPMKLYAFFGTPLTPATQETSRDTFEFTVQSGSEWQHFEFPLTEGKQYYGFGIYAKQSSGSTQYVPFDDIQIYTASPYAEYTAPVAATGVSVSPTNLELTTGHNSQLTATVAPNDATNKAVTWSSNNTNVATVDNQGNVHAVAAGNATITVTTDDGGFTATCAVTVADPVTYYPEGTFKGTASVAGSDHTIVIAIGNAENGLVGVRLDNQDAVATAISYNPANNTGTIATTGSYSSYTYGDISFTYDFANDRLTNIACGGSIKSYVSNNGSITATKPSTYYDCDGTTSQLQSTFKRRYMSGSWQVDTGNADRITSNTEQFVSGTGSVKRRGYSGGAVALNFQNDFSPTKSVKNIQFWVYNPSDSNITLRMWVYKAANFGSNAETGSVTAKAGQWTYVAMGFGDQVGSSPIYNFQIADFNNTGIYLSFDNIVLF